MLQDVLISNIEKLPPIYQQELLDFSNFLLSKIHNTQEFKSNKRGGFGYRKNDLIMCDDFDEPLEDFKAYYQ